MKMKSIGKLAVAFLLALVCFATVACKEGGEETKYELSLSSSAVEITVGENPAQLTATLTPANENEIFDWQSDNEDVATVDGTGLVTAVSAGNATVSVTAKGITKTCSVTVKGRVVPEVVVIDKEILSLETGAEYSYNISTTAANGKTVEITSSNPAVATVPNELTVKNGTIALKVNALGSGVATVNVVLNGVTYSFTVTVTDRVEVYLNEPTALVTVSDVPYDLDWELVVNDDKVTSSDKLIWSVDNSDVAEVIDGRLTAKSYGTATVSLEYRDTNVEIKREIQIKVYNAVATKEDFLAMRSAEKTEAYALTADVDFEGGVIPVVANNWLGEFDGNGYTVKNFDINAPENGLFVNMKKGSSVRNLTVLGAKVSASKWAGVITNRNDGNISDVYIEVTFASAGTSVNNPNAGIAARNCNDTTAKSGEIKNCVVIAKLSSAISAEQKKYVGAIVGYAMMKPIENCYAITLSDGLEVSDRRGIDTESNDCNKSEYFASCKAMTLSQAVEYNEYALSDLWKKGDRVPVLKTPNGEIRKTATYDTVYVNAGDTVTAPFESEMLYEVTLNTIATSGYTFDGNSLALSDSVAAGTRFVLTARIASDLAKTATVTFEVKEAAVYAPIDLSASGTDLNLNFAANNVESVSVGGNDVEFTFSNNVITVTDYKTKIGIANIGADAGEKDFTITADGVANKVSVLFATKIITQESLTEGSESQSFADIIFGQTDYKGYFILGGDLDLKGQKTVAKNTANNTPRVNFVFDGRGHAISNYTVSANNQSLFGSFSATGAVKNLKVTGVVVSGGNWVGVIACRSDGEFSDIYAEYSVSSSSLTSNSPAGLVARCDGKIKNCIAKVTVASDYANKAKVGALSGYVGTSDTAIADSFAIVGDSGINIVNDRSSTGTVLADKFTTCKAFTDTDALFADLDGKIIDVSGFNTEYWKFDSTNKTITFGAEQ